MGDGSLSFLGPFPSKALSYLTSTMMCFPIMSRSLSHRTALHQGRRFPELHQHLGDSVLQDLSHF